MRAGAASVATSTAGPPSIVSSSEALHKRPRLAPADEWPRTLADLEPIIAANTPLFFFHPSERCAAASAKRSKAFHVISVQHWVLATSGNLADE